MTLKINVLRGQDQIGGSIIEMSTETTRIIVDAGANLGEGKLYAHVPKVPGLFSGKPSYDAVFVSHYHSDHMGLLKHVVDGIPIYMGHATYDIALALSEYKGKSLEFSPTFMDEGVPVSVGGFGRRYFCNAHTLRSFSVRDFHVPDQSIGKDGSVLSGFPFDRTNGLQRSSRRAS